MLRPYQIEQLEELNNPLSCICSLPTGTGKGTLIAYQLNQDYLEEKRSLVVVPSTSLIQNISDRYLTIFGNQGTFDINTYQTLVNRSPQPYDSIYVDECHLSANNSISKILKTFGYNKLTGYSASPERLDGKKLSLHFDKIIKSPSPKWFIDNNYLSSFKLLTLDSPEVRNELSGSFGDRLDLQQKILKSKKEISNAVTLWHEHAYGLKTFFFCSGVEHANILYESFSVNFPEFNFAIVTADSSKEDVREALEGFRSGHYTGIFNVDMLILGIDVPDAECCYLLRFTYSLTRYLQAVGRVLRFKTGKTAIILDPLGCRLVHGKPDLDRVWSLEGKTSRSTDVYCKCSICQMPLIQKSEAKKLSKNFYYDTICDNCDSFNAYQFLPAQYRSTAKKRKEIDITLSELDEDEPQKKPKNKKEKTTKKETFASCEDQLKAIGYTEDQIKKLTGKS